MIIEVLGREIRKIKDKDMSSDLGRTVYKNITVLHCMNAPSKKDRDTVTGNQVFQMFFFEGNGLKSDVESFNIPCTLNADLSRNGQYINLEDYELI